MIDGTPCGHCSMRSIGTHARSLDIHLISGDPHIREFSVEGEQLITRLERTRTKRVGRRVTIGSTTPIACLQTREEVRSLLPYKGLRKTRSEGSCGVSIFELSRNSILITPASTAAATTRSRATTISRENLVNGRARSVGLRRLMVDLLAYQLERNARAYALYGRRNHGPPFALSSHRRGVAASDRVPRGHGWPTSWSKGQRGVKCKGAFGHSCSCVVLAQVFAQSGPRSSVDRASVS